jgi:hypothetical protein
MMGIETYFVCSDGNKPDRIFFDLAEAVDAKYLYLDVFDDDGILIKSYIYIPETGEYTDDF